MNALRSHNPISVVATEKFTRILRDPHWQGLAVYQKKSGRWHLVWLIYTAFFFFPLTFEQITGTEIFLNIALYGVLLSLTLLGMCSTGKRSATIAIVIVVIATATAGFNSGSNVFYGYAAFLIAFGTSRIKAIISFLAIVGCHFLAAAMFDLMKSHYLVPGIIPMIGLMSFGIIYREALIHAEKEHKSQKQIEQLATVAERERIARDLHDVLGHTLSSIALKSQLAEKLGQINDMEGALREIREVSEIASFALFEVRQAVTGYKAKTLDQQLESLLNRLRDKGMQVKVDCNFSPLNTKAEAALLLIITEAVTNILRHSDGFSVELSTETVDGKFQLRISDNGSVGCITKGNGLSGIDERLAELNGEMIITTDKGMCLTVTIGREFLQ